MEACQSFDILSKVIETKPYLMLSKVLSYIIVCSITVKHPLMILDLHRFDTNLLLLILTQCQSGYYTIVAVLCLVTGAMHRG